MDRYGVRETNLRKLQNYPNVTVKNVVYNTVKQNYVDNKGNHFAMFGRTSHRKIITSQIVSVHFQDGQLREIDLEDSKTINDILNGHIPEEKNHNLGAEVLIGILGVFALIYYLYGIFT